MSSFRTSLSGVSRSPMAAAGRFVCIVMVVVLSAVLIGLLLRLIHQVQSLISYPRTHVGLISYAAWSAGGTLLSSVAVALTLVPPVKILMQRAPIRGGVRAFVGVGGGMLIAAATGILWLLLLGPLTKPNPLSGFVQAAELTWLAGLPASCGFLLWSRSLDPGLDGASAGNHLYSSLLRGAIWSWAGSAAISALVLLAGFSMHGIPQWQSDSGASLGAAAVIIFAACWVFVLRQLPPRPEHTVSLIRSAVSAAFMCLAFGVSALPPEFIRASGQSGSGDWGAVAALVMLPVIAGLCAAVRFVALPTLRRIAGHSSVPAGG